MTELQSYCVLPTVLFVCLFLVVKLEHSTVYMEDCKDQQLFRVLADLLKGEFILFESHLNCSGVENLNSCMHSANRSASCLLTSGFNL